jgi:hypothetical protein
VAEAGWKKLSTQRVPGGGTAEIAVFVVIRAKKKNFGMRIYAGRENCFRPGLRR